MAQLGLFAPSLGPARFDPAFASARRIELSDGAWVEHVPGWVAHHASLFAELSTALAWRSETRRMYDRVVATPRLLARVPASLALPEAMRVAISARYGEPFVRVTAALYRDGNDSVAWHGDTTARDMDQALVATVSLGAPRRFLLKPTAGGASIALPAGDGALIVMGGTSQRTWRHSIPKTAHAEPRIALMFRPAWSTAYEL